MRRNVKRLLACVFILALGILSAPGAFAQQDVKVWNGDPLAPQYDVIFGGSGKPLGPMKISGALNGAFSGVVVVGAGSPNSADSLGCRSYRETARDARLL